MRVTHALAGGAILLAIVTGVLVTTVGTPIAAVALVVALAAMPPSRRRWPVIVVLAVLVGAPILSLGPFPDLTASELVIPIAFVAVLSQRVLTRSRSKLAPTRAARRVDVAIALFVAVLAANYLRSRYLLPTTIPGGISRTFFDYAVALATYWVAERTLREGAVDVGTALQTLLWASVTACVIGVGADILAVPLNFGSLRFSVFDYSSGAVRIGFLETFGSIGLALLVSRAVPVQKRSIRLALLVLFGVATYLSGGRATAIGLVLALLSYLVLTRRGRLIAPAAVAAVVIGVAMVPSLAQKPQVYRYTHFQAEGYAGRQFLIVRSFSEFSRHPIFGTGIGNAYVIYNPDRGLANFYAAQLEVGGHGTYTSLLKNLGIAGFAPFVAALLLALWALAQRMRYNRTAGFLFIMLMTLGISNFASGNGSDPIYFLFLGAAVAAIAERSEQVEPLRPLVTDVVT